jgi:nicotinamidase-related amidase
VSRGAAAPVAGSALLLVDLQNDFLHPDGAYARGGAASDHLSAAARRVVPLVEVARAAGVPVVVSRFTLHRGRGGVPLIAPHLHRLRPFLGPGDFEPGSWGHATVDEVGPPDAAVDKVAYSAFAHTHLDWWLRRVGVEHLVVAGIVTNGGVASTVRDAHVRDYEVSVLGDGCGAFDPSVHEATLTSLGSVVGVRDVAEQMAHWQQGEQ